MDAAAINTSAGASLFEFGPRSVCSVGVQDRLEVPQRLLIILKKPIEDVTEEDYNTYKKISAAITDDIDRYSNGEQVLKKFKRFEQRYSKKVDDYSGKLARAKHVFVHNSFNTTCFFCQPNVLFKREKTFEKHLKCKHATILNKWDNIPPKAIMEIFLAFLDRTIESSVLVKLKDLCQAELVVASKDRQLTSSPEDQHRPERDREVLVNILEMDDNDDNNININNTVMQSPPPSSTSVVHYRDPRLVRYSSDQDDDDLLLQAVKSINEFGASDEIDALLEEPPDGLQELLDSPSENYQLFEGVVLQDYVVDDLSFLHGFEEEEIITTAEPSLPASSLHPFEVQYFYSLFTLSQL